MPLAPKLPTEIPSVEITNLESGLTIESAHLDQPAWAGQTAKLVTFDTVRLADPDLTAAKLRESGWSDVVVDGGELGGLDLTGSTWRRVQINRARLSGLIMVEAELKDAGFTGAKLNLANLRFAKLARVTFAACDLHEADFAGAQLDAVTFIDCELTACDFTGTKMKNVDLRTSRLEQVGGIAGLQGATISTTQLISLAPEFAQAAGLIVKDN